MLRSTCNSCHSSGVFAGLPSDCVSCHQTDFDNAEPNHVAAGFATTCDDCHTINAWTGATIDHSIFALTGGHAAVNCTQCHTGTVFAGVPSDCVSCHQTDFDNAEPNHVAAGFATTCEDCHTVNAWTGATIDHSIFPLTAGHASVNCTQCHTGTVFAGLPSDCVSCHQTDYDGAPDHTQFNYPTDCEMCHDTKAWGTAVFDHSAFPLTGGHAAVDCTKCHDTGVFAGLATDCVSCHQQDYNDTTAPNHAQAGFPTDCEVCHTIASWEGAVFDHSNIPLGRADMLRSTVIAVIQAVSSLACPVTV